MIELTREQRAEAIASIERYFQEELDQPIGNIAAGALLNFMVEEVGPTIFNNAVRAVQQRMLERTQELDIEFDEDEFQYWRRRRVVAPKTRR